MKRYFAIHCLECGAYVMLDEDDAAMRAAPSDISLYMATGAGIKCSCGNAFEYGKEENK